jgi:3-(3-hydroxy-phenyl)propionate hydroxylase
MMPAREDCDVLIVGLGPVGAALAAFLVQDGVSVIAIDRESEVYPMPRAVHFDHEIMRLLQQLGLAGEMARHARDLPVYEFRTADGQVLMRMDPATVTPSGWGSGYMFHQPGLETALRDALAASPRADVRLGWRFEDLTQDAEGVSATIAGPDGPRTIRARYLVGCDGGSSPVRAALGGQLFDYQFDEPWLVVDVKVLPGAQMPDRNLQICDPARPTTCVMGGPGRHRWEFMMLPGETPEAMLADRVIQGLIAPWDVGPVEIERKAVYRFHGLVAETWRQGRVLLAGDAAHQTPPFAGQGLCSGLRDAANLAWKLAGVLRGEAADALLDTYQTEREPHVRAMIELAIGMGRLVCTLDREAAAQRDAGMLAQRASGAAGAPPPRAAPFAAGCILAGTPGAGLPFPQPTSGEGAACQRLDDVLGRGAWLIARKPVKSPTPGLRCVGLEAAALAPFHDALLAWLDRQSVDAVLVRPDRYVFGAGDPGRLLDAWTRSLAALKEAA